MDEFRKYCIQKMKEAPEYSGEIKELYLLARSEVEDGGSPEHEIELAKDDIESLIKTGEMN